MSRRMKELVKQHSKTRGAARRVLMVLADYANDDGVAWPSVQTLTTETGLSRRGVQLAIRQCENRYSEVQTQHKFGQPNRYRIAVEGSQRELFTTASGGRTGFACERRSHAQKAHLGGEPGSPDPDLIPKRSSEFLIPKTRNSDSSVDNGGQSDAAAQARTDALKRKPQAADVRTLCVETEARPRRLRHPTPVEDPVLVRELIDQALKIFPWRQRNGGP